MKPVHWDLTNVFTGKDIIPILINLWTLVRSAQKNKEADTRFGNDLSFTEFRGAPGIYMRKLRVRALCRPPCILGCYQDGWRLQRDNPQSPSLTQSCYPLSRMRRGVQVAMSVVAVLLLLKSFDCLSNGTFTRKAADCCHKGKCVPSTNADDCCKGTIPGGKQLVDAKAADHSAPVVFDLAVTDTANSISPLFVTSVSIDAHSPPGSPPDSCLNLPLLI